MCRNWSRLPEFPTRDSATRSFWHAGGVAHFSLNESPIRAAAIWLVQRPSRRAIAMSSPSRRPPNSVSTGSSPGRRSVPSCAGRAPGLPPATSAGGASCAKPARSHCVPGCPRCVRSPRRNRARPSPRRVGCSYWSQPPRHRYSHWMRMAGTWRSSWAWREASRQPNLRSSRQSGCPRSGSGTPCCTHPRPGRRRIETGRGGFDPAWRRPGAAQRLS